MSSTTEVACPMCSSSPCDIKYEGTTQPVVDELAAFRCTSNSVARPEVLVCRSCDHMFSNPSTWPNSLGDAYEALSDPDYLRVVHAKRRTFKRAADLVTRLHRKRGTLIEVGSYAGLFLEEMRKRGYDVLGIEPSTWGAQLSLERGLKVICSTLEAQAEQSDLGPFDVVVSWDVLEHVEDPWQMMQILARWTKPGGTLIISTLDRTNWFARRTGARWPWIVPMHLHYFDQDIVIKMADDNGLDFVETRAHVHYTTLDYVAGKLVNSYSRGETLPRLHNVLNSVVFPVGFGDVRLFAFVKR
jgi:SAM-dependent methyltransferase